jgi:undecaprenyl-phosphate galactose phosphotransferase
MTVNNVDSFPSFSCEIRHIPIKRIFDICFSFLLILICLPVFFLLALAIRISSEGKILYAHKRVGRGGKVFTCYKFRTMYADAEHRLKAILSKNPALQSEWEQSYKLKCDPRVTPLGAFLRKTSLDEFPQFWNVLKGDLSIVGPRPVVQEELITHIGTRATRILTIRPGLTGLWQVSGRSDTSYQKRIELDEQYIRDRSFWLDLKIIARTIPAMLFSKGAY